jgi:glycosyltransferase involved in cell wall biosynthesis
MTDICLVHGGDLSEPSGGTDRVSAFAAGLDQAGHDVAIVAPTPAGNVPDRLEPVVFVPVSTGTRNVINQPVRAVKLARKARAVADERDARLQIEHATLAGAAAMLGVSFDVLDMHDLSFRSPLYGELPLGELVQRLVRHIEGRALSEAPEIVVVSERMADLAVQEWSIARERLTVVPNGYFPEVIEPYREVKTVPGRVIFLGTLHPKVDIEAIRSVAELPAVSECIVIGDGPRRDELETMADDVERLRVTGRLPNEEAFPLLSSAAVAINPQHGSDLQAASSPVKLYYYAALGRPMVLSEGPELAEQLADAGAAVLVHSGSTVSNVVDTILADDGQRTEMCIAARNIGKRSSWSQRVTSLETLYSNFCTNQM